MFGNEKKKKTFSMPIPKSLPNTSAPSHPGLLGLLSVNPTHGSSALVPISPLCQPHPRLRFIVAAVHCLRSSLLYDKLAS